MKGLKCFFGVCVGRPHPDAHRAVEMASVAPHVRGSMNARHVERWRLYALMVVMVSAVMNVGQQYAFQAFISSAPTEDWRAGVIEALGIAPVIGDGASLWAFAAVGLVHVLPIFVMAYLSGMIWEGLFAHFRKRHRQPGLLATALVFTALMPPAAPLWHVAFAMSFAVVFAQEVFGGHGKTFLPPALVGAAVLQVSFPSAMAGHPIWTTMIGYNGTSAFALFADGGYAALTEAGIDAFGALVGNVQSTIGTSGVLAAIIGGCVMLWGRVANWRAPLGVGLGVIVATALTNGAGGLGIGWHWHVVLGGVAFSALFLATDPAGSSATNAGRWAQGVLAGVMVVLIRVYNPGHPDGIVPAFLFAAIMAPLIDAVVVRLQVRAAKRRAMQRRAGI